MVREQAGPMLEFEQIQSGMAAKPLRVAVTREMIANYCESVQEDDPVYTDDAAARRAGLPGIVCPASMHLVYAPQRRLDIMHAHGYTSPEEAAVNPRNTPFVGIEIRWHGVLVRPGDVISSTAGFAKKWETRSGNRFVGIGVTAHNQRGELVVDYQYNIVWELARGQKVRPAEPPAAAPAREAPQSGRALATQDIATVRPGDILPSATRRVTQDLINRYVSLNDWEHKGVNAIQLQHVDEAFASRTLFGGTTLHGPAAVGHMVSVLSRAFGIRSLIDGGTFIERALEPVRPGDTVVYGGRVLSNDARNGARTVEVEVGGTNQLGQTTATGRFTRTS